MLLFVEIIGKCLDLNDYTIPLEEKIKTSLSILNSHFDLNFISLYKLEEENFSELFKISNYKNKKIDENFLNKTFIKGEVLNKNGLFYFPIKDNYFIYGVLIIEIIDAKEEHLKFFSIFTRIIALYFKEHYREKKIQEKLEILVPEGKEEKPQENIFEKLNYTEDDKKLLHKLFSIHERINIFKVFFCYFKYSLNIKKAVFFKYDKGFIPQYSYSYEELKFVSFEDALKNYDKISFNKLDFNRKIKKIEKTNINLHEAPFCDLKLSKQLKDCGFTKITLFPIKLKHLNIGLIAIDGIISFFKINKISILCDLIAGILNYTKKINNLKLLYKKIEVQEKSSFFEILGEISHEIKNPIMAISGFSGRILRNFDRLEKDKIKKYLNIISQESHRLERLLKDLLIFSKTNKISFNLVNLAELIKETYILVENELKDKNIKVIFEYTLEPKVYGNKSLLKQVFLNIITNSIEAIKRDGKIFIKIKPKDKFCSITFEDTGGGIPEEILNKIFEPFFSTKEFGTGLGLTISYRIVQQHGGDIKIKNTDKGLKVEILIPCRR